METRKILVANSKDQSRYVTYTDITTLGEFKHILSTGNGLYKIVNGREIPMETGIDYTGMTFTEGFTKTQLLDDSSLLPTNITHKGQVTNDLVILLTNTAKKIASGMEDRSRAAAYSMINSLDDVDKEDIKEAIKEEFGRNYTQIPTNALWAFLDEYFDEENDEEEDTQNKYDEEDIISDVNEALKSSLGTLQQALEALNAAEATVQGCIKQLTALVPNTYLLGGTEISDNEINDMMSGI